MVTGVVQRSDLGSRINDVLIDWNPYRFGPGLWNLKLDSRRSFFILLFTDLQGSILPPSM